MHAPAPAAPHAAQHAGASAAGAEPCTVPGLKSALKMAAQAPATLAQPRGAASASGAAGARGGAPAPALALATSALPLGRPVRRSTPETQPNAGLLGHCGREGSSCAMTVFTKDA